MTEAINGSGERFVNIEGDAGHEYPLRVRPSFIAAISGPVAGKNGAYSLINIGGYLYRAKGTPDEIEKKIKEASRPPFEP